MAQKYVKDRSNLQPFYKFPVYIGVGSNIMPDRDLLTLWEEIYLLSIWELKDGAYGVAVKKAVSLKTGRVVSYGGLYFMLAQLAKKGFVVKTAGEPTPRRGGRRKYYYILTDKGKKALRTSFDLQKSLWQNIREPVFD
jgi:PadR family transcriptional regulator PadR